MDVIKSSTPSTRLQFSNERVASKKSTEKAQPTEIIKLPTHTTRSAWTMQKKGSHQEPSPRRQSQCSEMTVQKGSIDSFRKDRYVRVIQPKMKRFRTSSSRHSTVGLPALVFMLCMGCGDTPQDDLVDPDSKTELGQLPTTDPPALQDSLDNSQEIDGAFCDTDSQCGSNGLWSRCKN